MDKPNGLTVVRGDVAAFLAPLPIERMWGIGPKTAPIAAQARFQTLGDLAKATPAALERALGSWGAEVRELARGNDVREVVPDRDAKSIGAECTYERRPDGSGRDRAGRSSRTHHASPSA